MANNRVLIKRTSTSGTRPTTSNIANAELAVNLTDGIVFSTNGSTIFEVGANTTNSTVSGTLTLGGKVSANGGFGTATQVLLSGGSSTNAYWGTISGGGGGTPGGSTTQVQFNSSGSFGGSAGFTFTSSTNNLFIANTFTTGSGYNQTGNGSSVNATLIAVGNSSTDVEINSTAILVGNSSANITLVSNSTALDVRLANSSQAVNAMTTGVHTLIVSSLGMFRTPVGISGTNTDSANNFAIQGINTRSSIFVASSTTTNAMYLQFYLFPPPSWDGGTVTADIMWHSRPSTITANSTNNTATLYIRGLICNPGMNMSAQTQPVGSGSIVTNFISNNVIHITPNAAITFGGGTVTANSILLISISKAPNSAFGAGNFTFPSNMHILQARLYFTYNKSNDQ